MNEEPNKDVTNDYLKGFAGLDEAPVATGSSDDQTVVSEIVVEIDDIC